MPRLLHDALPSRPRSRTALALLAALVSLLALGSAEAHPFHFSFAEANWNEETRCLEVALRLEPHDLEAALRRGSKQPIRLEDEMAEKHLRAYLMESLQVSTSQRQPVKLKWLGAEIKIKAAWLYFEIPLPEGVEGTFITNTLLVDELSNQVNVMAIRQGSRGAVLQFSAKQPTQQVRLKENAVAESDSPQPATDGPPQ